jgi:hypothetical protein
MAKLDYDLIGELIGNWRPLPFAAASSPGQPASSRL